MAPCHDSSHNGTSSPTSVCLCAAKRAPGIAWWTAQRSTCVSLPSATSPASAAYAPAKSTALHRYTHANRAGHDLEARRRCSHLLAVELDREPLGGVDR